MRKSFVIMLIASIIFSISMTLIEVSFAYHAIAFLFGLAMMIWADQEDKKAEE